MIKIENLFFNYGDDPVLQDINLNIEKNTTCAIIGPSGCGKTTLLYILGGLLNNINEGNVYINGKELNGVRKETGVILQNNGLLPWRRAWDNVALGLKARGYKKEEINLKVSEMMMKLDIYEHRHKYPSQLSGGQNQRVAIGRTLVLEPDLMLMDEASSALDSITRENIQNILLDLYNKNKMTMVLITHSIEEAVFLGQKIIVMGRGYIKDIIDNPYFGDKDIKMQKDFYDICIKVRQSLYKEELNL